VRIGDLAAAWPALLTGIGGLFVDGLAGVVIGYISATAGAVATALDGPASCGAMQHASELSEDFWQRQGLLSRRG
jgi:hypothetical protein